MTTGKNIALTRQTFVAKIICLLFNTLSSFAGASQVVLVVKDPPSSAGELRNAGSILGLGRSPGEEQWQPTPVFLDFPGGSDGKLSACNAGDQGPIP